MFQPRADHTYGKVAGWSVKPAISGQFATALSRFIEPSGPSDVVYPLRLTFVSLSFHVTVVASETSSRCSQRHPANDAVRGACAVRCPRAPEWGTGVRRGWEIGRGHV